MPAEPETSPLQPSEWGARLQRRRDLRRKKTEKMDPGLRRSTSGNS